MMPLPWLIGAAVTAAATAVVSLTEKNDHTVEEKVIELDIDKTKNLISTLQRLKEKGSISSSLSIKSDGLGFGNELEKSLENLPVLTNQNVLKILHPHLQELLKPLKDQSIQYRYVKK